MAKQLSPKQFIQTKARSLPFYKAYVNKDWEEGKMAQVIVMRRHVNGNVTAGVYLVDLLCLGVKDTMFIFNETPAEIEERFGDEFKTLFEEVDYDLAHNIVFAGHDFAMDFEIKPHADFAVTKFVLADDNDDIPLIDVEVGTDGKPHLMVAQAGQYGDALAKLKKIAGEGNYYYTIGSDLDEDEDDDEDEDGEDFDDEESDEDDSDDDGNAYYDMDEFDMGEITPLQAQFIYADDLLDEERVSERAANEILTIQTEVALRTLKEIHPAYFEHGDKEDNIDLEFLENENYASGVTKEQEDIVITLQEQMVKFYEEGDAEGDANASAKMLLATLHQNSSNPIAVANIFENGVVLESDVLVLEGKAYLEKLADEYPLAQLTLALYAYFKGEDTTPYQFIYNSQSLADAYPNKHDLAEADLSTYSLLQTLLKLNDGDVKMAVYYYYLAAETEVFNWLLPLVQTAILDVVGKIAEADTDLYNSDADEEDTDEDDEDSTDDDTKPTLRIV